MSLAAFPHVFFELLQPVIIRILSTVACDKCSELSRVTTPAPQHNTHPPDVEAGGEVTEVVGGSRDPHRRPQHNL